jgi:hypothetical protein
MISLPPTRHGTIRNSGPITRLSPLSASGPACFIYYSCLVFGVARPLFWYIDSDQVGPIEPQRPRLRLRPAFAPSLRNDIGNLVKSSRKNLKS